MRVLVEQTRAEAARWLAALGLTDEVGLHVLMGGEEPDEWDVVPERDAILVGTQDMLLSRALHRGYGASRARWPLAFGLLNNDCLWFLDEVQLMGPGLRTTAQLEAFRGGQEGFCVAGATHTVWMSATLDPEWLQTVDLRRRELGAPLELDKADLGEDGLGENELSQAQREARKRHHARKRVERASCEIGDADTLAGLVRQAHEPGTLTIAVVNTVERAIALHEALHELAVPTAQKKRGRGGRGGKRAAGDETGATDHEARSPAPPAPTRSPATPVQPELVLLHSRFRPRDRAEQLRRALAKPAEGGAGTIIVSTQVIEAGVDVSAKRLYTDLAPWASMVQRLGRLNRRGEHNVTGDATAVWIDLPATEIEKAALPYGTAALHEAREALRRAEQDGAGVGPEALEKIQATLAAPEGEVLRRKDLVDLFDTTPDLAGNDIAIDRYVRDADDTDVQVLWRAFGEAAPSVDTPAPSRDELCRVGVGRFRDFLRKLVKADKREIPLRQTYRKRWLDGEWEPVRPDEVLPGQVYLVDARAGGYDPRLGWTGEVGRPGPVPVAEGVGAVRGAAASDPPRASAGAASGPLAKEPGSARAAPVDVVGDDNDADPLSQAARESIAQHTDAVCGDLEAILAALSGLLDGREVQALRLAARWHDRGKAHAVFQSALPVGLPPGLWAKAEGTWRRYERRGFRHELASALAVIEAPTSLVPPDVRDLVAYLVAAHHGKVRLSIRSLPREARPPGPLTRFARGIWDGDQLPETPLATDGVLAPAATLSLALMELGGPDSDGGADRPSWLARTLALRDDPELGPFRLAFLEALLRAADMRASRRGALTAEGKRS